MSNINVCEKCGAPLTGGNTFCERCGAKIQGMPPQGMPPQGMPPQGMPPQGMPPQGMPPQGMPQQGMPRQGMPPQGMPPQGAPKKNNSFIWIVLLLALIIGGGCYYYFCVMEEEKDPTTMSMEELEQAVTIQEGYNYGEDEEADEIEPEVIEPEVTEPEVTEPEVTEPEVTESQVTESQVTESQVIEVPTNETAKSITMSGVADVDASSYLEEYYSSTGNMKYKPQNVIDGDITTAWVEDASGDGIGEAIILQFDDEYVINGIEIYSGYHTSKDIYYKNNRPKEITVYLADGTEFVWTLKDTYGVSQVIEFEEPVTADFVSFQIESVYSGSKYQDTCISEITLF